MRFHGLMLVRDEADIIAENLQHVLEWADDVFIFDTGSTDGTWEFIAELAAREPRIKLFERSAVVYGNQLRAYLFDQVRHTFDDGDWVVKLDSDEFFHITPPLFVNRHLRKIESSVWLQWYFFRLTSLEVADYESGRLSITEDRKCSIRDRRRFYKIPSHSEPRMFKYRAGMKWLEKNAFPTFAGFVAGERIPILHYPHRDPQQMQARYALRATMKRLGSPAGSHWNCSDWRKDIIAFDGDLNSAKEQSFREGLSSVADHVSGTLHHWQPGSPLPLVYDRTHQRSPWLRSAQFCLYRSFVRVADKLQKGFTLGFRPTPASEISTISKAG